MKEQFDGLVAHLLDHSFFLEEAVEMLEKKLITCALERAEGNQSAASKVLGIHRNTLKKKTVEYGLAADSDRRRPVQSASERPARSRKAKAC